MKGSENVLVLEGGGWEVTGDGSPTWTAGRLSYLAGTSASEFVQGQSPRGGADLNEFAVFCVIDLTFSSSSTLWTGQVCRVPSGDIR